MFKRNKGKIALLCLAVILLAVGLCAIIGRVTKGFQDFDVREINPDNLLKAESYTEGLDAEREDGLKVTVNDDGVITVSGKNKTEEAIQIAVQEVTLEVGKYTLSSGSKETDEDTCFMSIVNGEETVIADTEDDSTIIITANDTVCTVYITVNAGENVDITFKPVLVEGSEAGAFYVIA